LVGAIPARRQTPQVPPCFAQCLQYLQFLQAWQLAAPTHFAARAAVALRRVLVDAFAEMRGKAKIKRQSSVDGIFFMEGVLS